MHEREGENMNFMIRIKKSGVEITEYDCGY